MKESVKRGIEASSIFLVIGTTNYFGSSECIKQVQYAKQLKKPFRILLADNAQLPTYFLIGVADYEIVPFDSNSKLDTKTIEQLVATFK